MAQPTQEKRPVMNTGMMSQQVQQGGGLYGQQQQQPMQGELNLLNSQFSPTHWYHPPPPTIPLACSQAVLWEDPASHPACPPVPWVPLPLSIPAVARSSLPNSLLNNSLNRRGETIHGTCLAHPTLHPHHRAPCQEKTTIFSMLAYSPPVMRPRDPCQHLLNHHPPLPNLAAMENAKRANYPPEENGTMPKSSRLLWESCFSNPRSLWIRCFSVPIRN